MRTSFFLTAIAAIACPILHVEAGPFEHPHPEDNVPKLVRVQMEFIELSHKDLTRLLMEDKSKTADATDLRMKLQKMVDEGKASILDTQISTARSGEQATTESIAETIYPTEYDPPDPLPSPDTGTASTPYPLGYSPVAFETRNVGSTLEMEPTIATDHKTINLRFVPELIFHTGNTKWQEFKDPTGNVYTVQMPDFYILRCNAAITCISGQYVMVSALSPKDNNGILDLERKVMLFAKCTVLPVVQ